MDPRLLSASRKSEKLWPFEIKDELIGLASEAPKKSACTLLSTGLSTGRGNPSWIAAPPPEPKLHDDCKTNLTR